ncbi:MAG: hypothetical protein K2Q26_15475 [Bdellovibrionales bacterium]|nr:hypothetical protein [Bdellovibrionales bacterium]
MTAMSLSGLKVILIHQVHEIGEWFGFETRNKYQILDETKTPIGFVAEQQKGILGFLFRQYLGHWRKFDVHFFTADRQLWLIAHHPFRWFFERIEIRDTQGQYIGAIQKRFSILTKRFDVENSRGMTVMEVSSPIWRLWTFTFRHQDKKVAEVQKKWSGIFSEMFTDKDNFLVEFSDPSLSEEERRLVMVSSVFVDLLYFEKKR